MVDEQIMVETERKIDSLEKEKDELLQQLKNVKAHENTNKVAEHRRKRVQELEDQLKDLKKKVKVEVLHFYDFIIFLFHRLLNCRGW